LLRYYAICFVKLIFHQGVILMHILTSDELAAVNKLSKIVFQSDDMGFSQIVIDNGEAEYWCQDFDLGHTKKDATGKFLEFLETIESDFKAKGWM